MTGESGSQRVSRSLPLQVLRWLFLSGHESNQRIGNQLVDQPWFGLRNRSKDRVKLIPDNVRLGLSSHVDE
jgi:hypothetical protein